MNIKVENLIDLLNSLPVSKWGIADLKGVNHFAEVFPKAISLVFAYNPDFETFNEIKFYDVTTKTKVTMKKVTEALKDFLIKEDVNYLVPEEKINENLVSQFSHKLAATYAGLGWIGKNSTFITDEYGPRVRLVTIFVDLDIPSNKPLIESRCGECEECVKACPHKCIHGNSWTPGIERDLLFDAKKCKKLGHKFLQSQNREFCCGFCVLSCPVGK
ncbi:MAG: 4Fe-4S double cluster binding domain-containing protein [Clostridiaceae bacterium]